MPLDSRKKRSSDGMEHDVLCQIWILPPPRVTVHVRKRNTSKGFLGLLPLWTSTVKENPAQQLSIVLNNLNTHIHEAARKW
jgi:hypothetical protein